MNDPVRTGLSACSVSIEGLALEQRRRILRALPGSVMALLCSSVHTGERLPEAAGPSVDLGIPLALAFAQKVEPRLYPTLTVTATYATALQQTLDRDHRQLDLPQFVLVVDRNPHVQAVLAFWGGAGYSWRLLGASPVSTGLPGRYEHFATPLGVFDHVPTNPDFRAEGTRNALGIRGYGVRGSRVFDFGWVQAPKGWGNHAVSNMRLQMHATDSDVLEPRLGTAQSKGCIRISASLNGFIDLYGLIDKAYELEAEQKGRPSWVLRKDRVSGPWAGRYLVVVDSLSTARPIWSPVPTYSRQKKSSNE